MSIVKRDLRRAKGFTPGVGYYLAGMEEVHRQVVRAVEGISPADIGRAAVPGAHSIGALVLHIAESEWFWANCVIQGKPMTDENRPAHCWDALKDPERVKREGYSADFCLNQANAIREQTRTILASLTDNDLERGFKFNWGGQDHDQSL